MVLHASGNPCRYHEEEDSETFSILEAFSLDAQLCTPFVALSWIRIYEVPQRQKDRLLASRAYQFHSFLLFDFDRVCLNFLFAAPVRERSQSL
ncbi:hypothetical protein AVEN_235355-1 [Araneus ventricosus]|uniref:Uncharacterized protein n=1 Tax=Araneus ventricosus TaxID=182803 RepID=A0A4Y2A3P0_ARAVE|nr:hypothetical protein AVEN_235355-1 [Araneus ventricosus]